MKAIYFLFYCLWRSFVCVCLHIHFAGSIPSKIVISFRVIAKIVVLGAWKFTKTIRIHAMKCCKSKYRVVVMLVENEVAECFRSYRRRGVEWQRERGAEIQKNLFCSTNLIDTRFYQIESVWLLLYRIHTPVNGIPLQLCRIWFAWQRDGKIPLI